MTERKYEVLSELDQDTVKDFIPLLSQLNRNFAALDYGEKQALIEANLNDALENGPATIVLVHRNPRTERIVATATGNIVLGREGWVDDVVTQRPERGQGIGRMLLEGLHDQFLSWGVTTSRVALPKLTDHATHLFDDLGYQRSGHIWQARLDPTNSRRTDLPTSFETVVCRVPTGAKPWIYGPTFDQDEPGLSSSLLAAHAELRMHGAHLANYISETSLSPELASSLEQHYYRQRGSQMYSIDLARN